MTTTNNAVYHKQANPKEQGFYGLIYITINTVNNKIYIGQTTTFKDFYIGSGLHFSRAVKKYGKKNFNSYLLQYAKDKEELDHLEQMYIASFNSTNPTIGYNIAVGGLGSISGGNNPRYGKPHSEEARQKMSEAKKGIALSDEHKKKLSEALKGKYTGENSPMYGKTGENSPMYGKTHSEKTKRKISEANTKDKSHITDDVLFQYLQSCKDWAREIPADWGVSHSALKKMFKKRYNTDSNKQVQIIIADLICYKVLNHINFIEYCKHHKDNFLQMSSKVFGISGEQLQRWAARTYTNTNEHTINGWVKYAETLEAARQRRIKKKQI